MPLEVSQSFPGRPYVSAYIPIFGLFFPFPHPTDSLFKNQVENASIKLRAGDERNWPSFLYPEGTEYDELELEKGLFRGHVFLRVCSLFLPSYPLIIVHHPLGFAHYIHREILCVYWPPFSFQTFTGRDAWHAASLPRSGCICRRPGKSGISIPVSF